MQSILQGGDVMADHRFGALEQAGRELMTRRFDPATWALGVASCGVGDGEARAAYIKLRVPLLVEAFESEARE